MSEANGRACAPKSETKYPSPEESVQTTRVGRVVCYQNLKVNKYIMTIYIYIIEHHLHDVMVLNLKAIALSF